MLKSMTGFGRSEISGEDRKITVEMKAVNHRYCDISVKMPKKLSFFEAGIRNVLKQYIGRGKIDVFITYEDFTENNICVKYNSDLAKEYYTNLDKMSKEFGIENDIRVSALSRYPEVLTLEEQTINEKELWQLVEDAVRGAAERFVETRIAEGENLKLDIISKLNGMLSLVEYIEERSPEIVTEYRNKLMTKVTELLGDTRVDESMLVTEVTIFADKICVDEETVRLRSHIANMKDTLEDSDNVGRKLDFIAQEMNREANTILSKANDLEVTNKAIDLKTEIEKIREQIQNIE
ncbi:YicC family protein [Mobilitalea sibirica]|uniref:YicC family protein n=1 Tax=Mobilitalea sibirica TaxID=1462919 RepID=A0A8J7H375_9FIRM|nr:YicC/YloC family endoribonuclease [Mobilitalea sibirica]MBH1941417.1 YicC family protein [Mobilitalea sibirica]